MPGVWPSLIIFFKAVIFGVALTTVSLACAVGLVFTLLLILQTVG